MGGGQRPKGFHFFRDVWFEDPRQFLDEDDFAILQQYMPMVRALEMGWRHRHRTDWDLNTRFNQFVLQETKAWEARGAVRPAEFLLRPSGTITASIALHLLNPTFYVANPYSSDILDTSSPTMHLLHENGFSSENSFVFDQICRRDDTNIVLRVWTDDVYKPHDDFVRDLRLNMAAIVEICWGENAWRRVSDEVCLVQLPLWGDYQDVKLYLELDESRKGLKRFVFWVHHPQWFFMPKRSTNSISNRVVKARAQDASIELATRLVGLQLQCRDRFYETLTRNSYPRLTNEQRTVRYSLIIAARAELRAAYPTQARDEKKRQQRLEIERLEKSRQIQEVLADLRTGFDKGPSETTLGETSNDIHTEYWAIQRQRLKELAESWLDVIRLTLQDQEGNGIFFADFSDAGNQYAAEDFAARELDWIQLPTELVNWLQNQDGLKVDQGAINTREEVERAFGLLHSDETALLSKRIETTSAAELAIQVAWKYTEAGYAEEVFFLWA
ncbi:hypothetical protein BJY00DRAFT_309673 [Aspergillus carlsbadensis]|nr:hypothetical protein BJY00DRAFT_309673 [Aspergillus carlsbadensis]